MKSNRSSACKPRSTAANTARRSICRTPKKSRAPALCRSERLFLFLLDIYFRDAQMPTQLAQAVQVDGADDIDERQFRWLCGDYGQAANALGLWLNIVVLIFAVFPAVST